MGELVFILGPVRSGKSRLAEQLAADYGPKVLYVATLEPGDDEMVRRTAAHRAARPEAWTTLEEPTAVLERLRERTGYDACLLDCLTLWVTNLLLAVDPAGEADADSARDPVLRAVRDLLSWESETGTPLIIVSNEVGSGVVPASSLGRAFRDILGEANQLAAEAAARFYYAIAGYYLDVKSLGAGKIHDFPR